jgi:hypothetical protein
VPVECDASQAVPFHLSVIFLMRSELSGLSVCRGQAKIGESEASQAIEVTTTASDFSQSTINHAHTA